MICINNKSKFRLLCLLSIAAVFLSGCGNKTELKNEFPKYENVISESKVNADLSYFGQNLCKADNVDFGTDEVISYTCGAAGAFNVATKEVVYSQKIYEKMYPASMTKVLTAYIIIKNSNLNDIVTVSDNAVALSQDATKCDLKAGDSITVHDLLYGLMLPSGNDAAMALAEYYSGSYENFAVVMNETAKALGCTNSNFVNPSGMPDENHYTCVYDMYLMFNAAIQLDTFKEIIATESITVTYKNIQGESVTNTYSNTNRYLKGSVSSPEGFKIIGGKTGTTNDAGSCLILLSYNSKEEPIISVVMKSDSKTDLYNLMTQILTRFGN